MIKRNGADNISNRAPYCRFGWKSLGKILLLLPFCSEFVFGKFRDLRKVSRVESRTMHKWSFPKCIFQYTKRTYQIFLTRQLKITIINRLLQKNLKSVEMSCSRRWWVVGDFYFSSGQEMEGRPVEESTHRYLWYILWSPSWPQTWIVFATCERRSPQHTYYLLANRF